MSRGDKRRLELAMCLVQQPKLLLLDEPTAGMSRADTNATIDLLKRDQARRGMTMVIIEHDMHVVFSLADRITVLAQGTPHRRGPARAHQGQPQGAGSLSRRAPLRRPHDGDEDQSMMNAPCDRNASHAATAPAFFSVRDIHAYYGESYIVQGVSFNVHEGEILALLGRNGAGKTSTLRAIARAGAPELAPRRDLARPPAAAHDASHQAAQAGIGLVPEDRRIIAGLTVEENLQLAQIAPPVGWSLERHLRAVPAAGRAAQAGGRRRCRAASSRCWRSPGRWPATSSCCCSTSPTRGWRR